MKHDLEREREQAKIRKRRQRQRATQEQGRVRLTELYVDPRDKERVLQFVERVNRQREENSNG